MTFTPQEHLAGLLIAGYYYCVLGDQLGANTCWETGATLLRMYIRLPRQRYPSAWID